MLQLIKKKNMTKKESKFVSASFVSFSLLFGSIVLSCFSASGWWRWCLCFFPMSRFNFPCSLFRSTSKLSACGIVDQKFSIWKNSSSFHCHQYFFSPWLLWFQANCMTDHPPGARGDLTDVVNFKLMVNKIWSVTQLMTLHAWKTPS